MITIGKQLFVQTFLPCFIRGKRFNVILIVSGQENAAQQMQKGPMWFWCCSLFTWNLFAFVVPRFSALTVSKSKSIRFHRMIKSFNLNPYSHFKLFASKMLIRNKQKKDLRVISDLLKMCNKCKKDQLDDGTQRCCCRTNAKRFHRDPHLFQCFRRILCCPWVSDVDTKQMQKGSKKALHL